MSSISKSSGRKRQKLDNNPIYNIIIFLVLPFIIVIPIILVLSNCYFHIQSMVFSNENSLLFIYDNKSLMVLIIAPIILIYLLIIIIRNKDSMKIKIDICITFIIFTISTVFLSFNFFHYIDVNRNGIVVNKGLSFEKKHYDWEDVKNVKVFYKYGYKRNINVYYNIYLTDKRVINTYDSKQFFSKIIVLDTFIKKEKIKIIRSEILSQDKPKFKIQFEGKGSTSVNRLDVLKKIFIE